MAEGEAAGHSQFWGVGVGYGWGSRKEGNLEDKGPDKAVGL